MLLPLDKGRAGEEAPTFVVSVIVPAAHRCVGADRDGRSSSCRRSICRCRAPVSSFTTRRAFASSRSLAHSAAKTTGPAGRAFDPRCRAAGKQRRWSSHSHKRAAAGLQALVDRFRNEAGGRTVVGTLPVHVMFPAFGPSLFLASELTAESQCARRRARVQAREPN